MAFKRGEADDHRSPPPPLLNCVYRAGEEEEKLETRQLEGRRKVQK